jgi:hypothetical protein
VDCPTQFLLVDLRSAATLRLCNSARASLAALQTT